MDGTDRAILEQLRENGRLSNLELADRVNLTPAPCMRRVRRLEADGVITGYHARIDPKALGQEFEVIVHVVLVQRDRETLLAFEERVIELPEVVDARRMFGAIDYVLRVATRDLESYETFALDRLGTIPGVASVESHIALKVLKREPV